MSLKVDYGDPRQVLIIPNSLKKLSNDEANYGDIIKSGKYPYDPNKKNERGKIHSNFDKENLKTSK